MKKTNRKLSSLLLAFILVLTLFPFGGSSYGATDTKGPEIDLSTLEISKKKITDPHECPMVRVKITDQSGIQQVSFFYYLNGDNSINAAGVTLEYNEETGYYEGVVQYENSDENGKVGYYGEYKLEYIQTSDYYGNFTNLMNFPETSGNFEIVGGKPNDNNAPAIDYKNITVEKKIKKGEQAVMTVPISDDSEILAGNVWYTSESGQIGYSSLRKIDVGLYEATFDFPYEGIYQIMEINAIDANANRIVVMNRDHVEYDQSDERPAEALGFLDIQYGNPPPKDFHVSIKSITLSEGIVDRNGELTATVVFDASSPLSQASISYDLVVPDMEVGGGIEVTQLDDYTFRFVLPTEYYGPWVLKGIHATDAYGNKAWIYDPETNPHSSGVLSNLPFKDYGYHVGIVDSETGLGVSDAKFDDTTELLVDEEALDGELSEALVEEGSKPLAIYDVEVEGKRDDETIVSLVAPEGIDKDDVVTVVHQRHDGTKETFPAEVKHGRITIETDEFSPFVIQVDEYCKHRTTVEKNVPAKIGKNGAVETRCSHCNKLMKSKAVYSPKTVKLSKTAYTYDGKIKMPTVTVTDSKGNTLKKKTDYTVQYAKGRKQPGRYAAEVKFKGKYSGSKTVYFNILPKAPSSVKATLSTAKGGYNDVKVSWKKAVGASGYTVYYKKATAKKFTKLIQTTGTTAKINNLKDGVKYTVKVVPYLKSGGKKYSALQSKTASVFTLKKVNQPKAKKNGAKVKVTWKNIDGETGYQISCLAKKSGINIVSTYETTKGTYKNVAAPKGKTVYYKVRAYKLVNGKKIFGPWSEPYKYVK